MTALVYLVCAAVWGTTWFGIRVCLRGYPPFLGIALRLSLAAVILLIMAAVMVKAPRWPGRTKRALVLAGFCNAVSFVFIYSAEKTISGGLAAVIFGTMPIMTSALAAAIGLERVRFKALPGVAAALLGVTLVFSDGLQLGSGQARGVVLALGSVLASAIFTVVVKREANAVHPVASSSLFMLSAAGFAWVAAIADGQTHLPRPLPVAPSLAILYLAIIGSVLVFICYFALLKRVSVFTASTLVFLEPLIALLVDHLFEPQPLGTRTALGIIVTLVGVMLSILAMEKTQVLVT